MTVEKTCGHNNGGCQDICTETQTGVNCSCSDGYRLVNGQFCEGKQLI